MDFSSTSRPTSNFYLSSLEEQVMSEMGDSTARLTQTTEGRVNINIREDLLEKFLNDLQELRDDNKNNWSQERTSMQREMQSLKAQLKDAQENYELLLEESDDHRSKMGKICTTLPEAQCELKQQTCDMIEKRNQMKEENKALQDKLEKLNRMKEQNKALQDKIKKMDKVREQNKALQDKMEKLDRMKEQNKALQDKIEKLDKVREQNKALQDKIKKLDRMKEQKKAPQDKMEKLDKVREENETLRNELEAIKLELGMEKQLRVTAERNILVTTHSLNTLSFEKDTAEFEARSKAKQLEADLAFERTRTQKVEGKLRKVKQAGVEWQKVISDLIQTAETLEETLQAKEQEWKETKEIMDTHIKGLHTYATEKLRKRRRRWWNLF